MNQEYFWKYLNHAHFVIIKKWLELSHGYYCRKVGKNDENRQLFFL